MGVPQVKWDKDVSEQGNSYTLFCGNGCADYRLKTGCVIHKDRLC